MCPKSIALLIVDPLNLQGSPGNLWLDKGGMARDLADTKFLGYMDSQWGRGLSWAPINDRPRQAENSYFVQGHTDGQ